MTCFGTQAQHCGVCVLQDGLSDMMSADPPHNVTDVINFVKAKKQEHVSMHAIMQLFVSSVTSHNQLHVT